MKDRSAFLGSWAAFLAVLSLLMFLVVAFAGRFDRRFDLTDSDVYTVSASTKKILSELEDVVTIQYYVSENLPTMIEDLPRDTRDVLREYERLSGGKVQFEVVDPEQLIADYVREKEAEEGGEDPSEVKTFSPFGPQGPRQEKEQELADIGVFKLQGQVIENDEFKITSFYSSIVIRYLDKPTETITTHQAIEGLEYELANRILKLTRKDKPKVAFFLGNPSIKTMTPHPQFPQQLPPVETHPYQALIDQAFADSIQVVNVELTEESRIPADVRILIVAEPNNLNERQLYELDRFIVGGGTALIWASSTSGEVTSGRWGITSLDHGLNPMLAAWGVRMQPDMVFSIQCGMVVRRQNIGGGFVADAPGPWPACPLAAGANIDQEAIITAGLNGLVFPYASSLDYDEDKLAACGLDLRVLARSNDESWRNPWAPSMSGDMVNPPEVDGEWVFQGSFDLAYLIEGVFPSPFKAGDPVPSWPKSNGEDVASDGDADDESEDTESDGSTPEAAEPETIEPELVPALEPKAGRVILCASSDMAKLDYLRMEGYSANVQFFVNVVESYGLGQGLDRIRNKKEISRPIKKLTRGEKQSLMFSAIGGLPFLMVLFGVLRYLSRRRSARAYEERYLREGGAQ